jgi:hypothetical protein
MFDPDSFCSIGIRCVLSEGKAPATRADGCYLERSPQLPLNLRQVDPLTGAFIGKREDALFLGPGGTGKSHLAQAIGQAAIQQGYRVLYRETHVLLDELADAVADGTRKEYMESVATVPLLIIDDFGMRNQDSLLEYPCG